VDLSPVTLYGRHITLVPLTRAHHPALSAVGLDPELWSRTTIRVQSPEEMQRYVETALAGQAAGTALPFVITLTGTGDVVGTTRYHTVIRERRQLEIGCTWIARPWQHTAINPESKYLLLRRAFEVLGCQRVEFRIDSENEPSRRALLKIGAVEEGTLPRYINSAHRGIRDASMFSIVAARWPAVKSSLEARLSVLAEQTPSAGGAISGIGPLRSR
jgi:RimJ/RimL family protein N-acetyltransferase